MAEGPLEAPFWRKGLLVAGLDEAGRGAWAGPIVVGVVVLPPGEYPFRDSKLLSPRARERLAEKVKEVALAFALGVAEAAEVDRLAVLKATLLAAESALLSLPRAPAGPPPLFLFLKNLSRRGVVLFSPPPPPPPPPTYF